MIEAIDRRLRDWAEYRMGGGMRVGGTGNSNLAAVIDGKGVVIRSTATGVQLPDQVLDTDQAVARLQEDLRAVVELHYLQPNLSPDQRAAKCRVSRKTFYRRLDTAHQHVLYLLSPKKVKRVKQVRSGCGGLGSSGRSRMAS